MALALTTLPVDLRCLCILLAAFLLSCHPGLPCSACCCDLFAPAERRTSLFILPERRNTCSGGYGSVSPRNWHQPTRRPRQSFDQRDSNITVSDCLCGWDANRCRDDRPNRQIKLINLSPQNDQRNSSQDDKHTVHNEAAQNGFGWACNLPDQHEFLHGSRQTLSTGTGWTSSSRQQTALAHSHCKFILHQQLPRCQPWEIRLGTTAKPSRIVDCHPQSYFQRTIKNVNTTNIANDIHHVYFLAQEGLSLDLHEYELVYPMIPNAEEFESKTSRFRRSLTNSTSETNYIIQAFGKSFNFQWNEEPTSSTPFSGILAPHFVVQRVNQSTTWLDEAQSIEDGDWLQRCLRTGSVNGNSKSKAVMDLCWNTMHNLKRPSKNPNAVPGSHRYGLMGAFQLANGHYTIQPAGGLTPSNSDSNRKRSSPHIIYKSRPITNSDHIHTSVSPLLYKTVPRSGRRKRELDLSEFASNAFDYHVELLIVADFSMRQFHGRDLDEYILTLMSIVSMIYRDASIGNSITISITKLVVLESESEGPRVSWSAQDTLESFCKWQSTYNTGEDSHPYHHDAALLLTRQDLCRIKNKCDTLGLAEIGTMCNSQKSCAIVEDSGLSSAFTIAHELGHLFNIPHDDDRVCRNHLPTTFSPFTSVMAPRLDHNTNPWSWSPCSAKKLTDFLESGEASCLLDEPGANSNNIPTVPGRAYLTQGGQDYSGLSSPIHSFLFPGEMFEVDKQCQLVFGEGATVCPFMPVCKRLWCTTSLGNQTGCRTQHLPWADGTFCANNMWCRRGECVKKDLREPLKPIDGGWNDWSSPGKCSRTCGGGVKEQVRECNRPKPENGGKYCIGERKRYKSCNIKECEAGQIDFREQQCAAFNGKTMGYKGVEPSVIWKAKLYGQTNRQKCKLYCKVDGTSKFFLLKEKVIDGTSCGPDPSDICVNGVCKKAGCDGKLDSLMSRDTCNVCGGDNSTCRTVAGTYNERNYGYNFVTTIPMGASNIDIRQHAYEGMKDDYNYLALTNSEGVYLFNGDFIVSIFRKEIPVKNAVIDYTGSDTIVERINSTHAIGEALSLYVLTVGELYPPDIYYSYMISVGDEYRWDSEMGSWNPCSKECRGTQYKGFVCVRKMDRHPVPTGNCMGQEKPAEQSRPCNELCTLRWDVVEDPESQCDAACNEVGKIRRRIRCLREDEPERQRHGETHLWYQDNLSSQDQRSSMPRVQEVDLEKCNELAEPKPADEIPCTGSCRVVGWRYTAWSECSRPCGGGYQSRSSICVDLTTSQSVPPYNCSFHQTPEPVQRNCNPQPCAADWTVGAWSTCSMTCGPGVMRRAVKCLLRSEGTETEDSFCDPLKKPAVAVRCPDVPCPPPPISRPPPVPRPPVMVHALPKAQPGGLEVEWATGPWTACSKTCGVGEKYRSVGCRGINSGEYLAHVACVDLPKPHEREKCAQAECGAWQFGEWGSCTATCDDGLGGSMQRRYVACVVNHKVIKDESECDKNTRPMEHQRCSDLPTCETQSMMRVVDNGLDESGQGHSLTEVKYENYYNYKRNADKVTKPPATDVRTTTVHSSTAPRRGVWITGGWGRCSKSCNGGQKLRLVVCQAPESSMRESEGCDASSRPANITRCNEQACPEWIVGRWSECDKTSAGCRQRRIVQCIDSRGSHMSNYHCRAISRPENSQACSDERCLDDSPSVPLDSPSNPSLTDWTNRRPQLGKWLAGSWSPCTSPGSCGTGLKERQVLCVNPLDEHKEVNSTFCLEEDKPVSVEQCRMEVCPKWRVMPWSECSTSCGVGYRSREIVCAQGGLNQLFQATMTRVDDSLCRGHKPKERRSCEVYSCPGLSAPVRWSISKWSVCSTSCDTRKQSRTVDCVLVLNRTSVPPMRCRLALGARIKQPAASKICRTGKACAFRWIAGDWSDCSRTCDLGQRWRRVNCHKVDEFGQTIWHPVESPYRCDTRTRPKERTSCTYGKCSSYAWKVDKWSPCSKTCGGGISSRDVHCVHAKEQLQLAPSFCKQSLKPPNTKPCGRERCVT